MTTLPDFRLEVYLAKWEFAARWHMTASDAETLTLKELLGFATDEQRARFENLPLGYVETWGSPALRDAIAQTYDRCAREDVLCFAGAEEGLYCAMHALLGPSDHAVVVTPGYQSSEEVPRSLCEVTGVPLRPERDWDLDLDELTRALRSSTRLVAINFPHNPTGKVMKRPDFDALVELCRMRGIWLFSDEVYRGLELDDSRRLPAAVDAYERGLSLGVMSKAYGLAGLRVGWIAARDRELLGKMERIRHYLSICNAGPSELLAIIALENRARVIDRNRTLMRENLVLVEELMRDHADRFEWKRPDGGCIAYPRYLGRDGVEAFCKDIVEREGVVLLPASMFQSSLAPAPMDRFRIGFGRKHVPGGLAAMRHYLAAHSE